MNVAISFSTTTTWQAYAGEITMSYVSQIVGLAVQNFLAGASGLAVGVAFIRGFARQETASVGNFWFDLVRSVLWVLLPVCVVGSLVLAWTGVPMTWGPYVEATTLEGATQTIARGPIAAFEIIKNLGTNGGGFFNVNGAHPFETPTPLANLVNMLAIAVVPAAFTYTFGTMIGRRREGWMLLSVMALLFAAGLLIAGWAEQGGNPLWAPGSGVTTTADAAQPGGNMEGKEVRFGIGGSVLAAVTTSNGATGSYNSAHDSYTPLGGAVPLVNMLLGEMIFGGLGTGLYSIVMVVLVGLFLAGLMVGRTPEYLGKKLGPREMKLIALYTITGPVILLALAGLAVINEWGLAGLTTNDGAHGFSEIMVAYVSSLTNNGQNFAGLSANSPFYNLTTALAMMVGRFMLAVAALATAGLFAAKVSRPLSPGTLRTDSTTFAAVLIGTALIVGGLSYFPALALGPIVEHLKLLAG
jgi:K+-transporting ATPase ATPase A chain